MAILIQLVAHPATGVSQGLLREPRQQRVPCHRGYVSVPVRGNGTRNRTAMAGYEVAVPSRTPRRMREKLRLAFAAEMVFSICIS